jgi:hypothetical protein
MKNKIKFDNQLWLAIIIAMLAGFILALIFAAINLAFGFGGIFTVMWILMIPIVRELVRIYIDTNCFGLDDLLIELMEDNDEKDSDHLTLDD